MNKMVTRQLVPFLRDVAYGRRKAAAPARAAMLLRKIEAPKPATSKSAKERKEQRKAAAWTQVVALRAAVFQRAADVCELICMPGNRATELHHLEGGSGRKALQKMENCVAACWWCHRDYHRNPEAFRARIMAWASHYGYPIPRRFRGEAKAIP